MTVRELENLGFLTAVTPASDTTVTNVYCGDLLSHVMGKAPEGAAWVTVMNNVNAVAVATLADIACIVFADGITPAPDVIDKARENDVSVFVSSEPIFDTARKLYEAAAS